MEYCCGSEWASELEGRETVALIQHHHSSFPFYIHCVRAGRGLDVPKQITLSDHCFGFKLVHNFHRPDALPGVKPPISSLGELLYSMIPPAGDLVKIQNHCHNETKERIGRIF